MSGEMVVLEYGPLPFYCCVLFYKKKSPAGDFASINSLA